MGEHRIARTWVDLLALRGTGLHAMAFAVLAYRIAIQERGAGRGPSS
jgi:hypothetical protein